MCVVDERMCVVVVGGFFFFCEKIFSLPLHMYVLKSSYERDFEEFSFTSFYFVNTRSSHSRDV